MQVTPRQILNCKRHATLDPSPCAGHEARSWLGRAHARCAQVPGNVSVGSMKMGMGYAREQLGTVILFQRVHLFRMLSDVCDCFGDLDVGTCRSRDCLLGGKG